MTVRRPVAVRSASRAGRRPPGPSHPPRRRARRDEDGSLAFEWVLTLPVLLLLGTGLLLLATIVRDVLVLEEAVRSAARTAAVTRDDVAIANVARDAAPELPHLHVTVRPAERRAGDHVTVTATTTVRRGFLQRELQARAVTLVEPIGDHLGDGPAGFPAPGFARGPTGDTAPRGPPGPPGPADPPAGWGSGP